MQKSASGGTQTTTTEPPAYLKPYLTQAANAASQQYAQGAPAYYPGSQVAPMSDATTAGLSGTVQRAQDGSPLVDQAQQFVQQGLGQPISSTLGQSVNPYATPVDVQQVSAGNDANPYATSANPFGGASNPYLDAAYNQAFGKAMGSVESQFARGGRNISSALPVASDIASSLATQIYAPAYESERNRQANYASQQLGIGANSWDASQARQLQAGMANQSAGLQAGLAGQQIGAQGYEGAQNRQLQDLVSQRGFQQGLLGYASPLAAQDYADLAALRDAGSAYDTQSQAVLNDQINRYNYEQNAPGMTLDAYIQRLQGMPGSTSTTQLPTQYRNTGTGLLGGALAGAQLGSVIPGIGTGIGALGGAILGGLL